MEDSLCLRRIPPPTPTLQRSRQQAAITRKSLFHTMPHASKTAAMAMPAIVQRYLRPAILCLTQICICHPRGCLHFDRKVTKRLSIPCREAQKSVRTATGRQRGISVFRGRTVRHTASIPRPNVHTTMPLRFTRPSPSCSRNHRPSIHATANPYFETSAKNQNQDCKYLTINDALGVLQRSRSMG